MLLYKKVQKTVLLVSKLNGKNDEFHVDQASRWWAIQRPLATLGAAAFQFME